MKIKVFLLAGLLGFSGYVGAQDSSSVVNAITSNPAYSNLGSAWIAGYGQQQKGGTSGGLPVNGYSYKFTSNSTGFELGVYTSNFAFGVSVNNSDGSAVVTVGSKVDGQWSVEAVSLNNEGGSADDLLATIIADVTSSRSGVATDPGTFKSLFSSITDEYAVGTITYQTVSNPPEAISTLESNGNNGNPGGPVAAPAPAPMKALTPSTKEESLPAVVPAVTVSPGGTFTPEQPEQTVSVGASPHE